MLSSLIPSSSHEICKVTFKLPVLPDSIPSYIWSQRSIQLLSAFLAEPDELLAVLVCPCSVLEKYETYSQGEAPINAVAAGARLLTRVKLCRPALLLRELGQKQRH